MNQTPPRETDALRQELDRTRKKAQETEHRLNAQCAAQQQQIAQLEQSIRVIHGSFSWRLTRPLRAVTGGARKLLTRFPYLYRLCRGGRYLMRHGFAATWRHWQVTRKRIRWSKTWRKTCSLICPPDFGCRQEDYEAQRQTAFPRDIKFSILVPLYNTPEDFLREMIQSVRQQTYENWELCLADGSDADHPEVEQICRALVAEDGRIRYEKLARNLGISGNTNACIDMATGDYIGLFDHDDLLHPYALFEDMKAICEGDADFLYTDENTFRNKPEDAYCPHFKPDFSPDTLRSYNYICHFTVFSRSLLEQVGRFRPKCDGSQDYDLILRLTERARHIVHIPKILYYWRASANSTAADISAKPYVTDAARVALTDHLRRLGLEGTVEHSRIPSTYRIRYDIERAPLVSILIPSCDHRDTLKRCIDSILNKSTYPNFEIVIVENNSKDPDTFAYYGALTGDGRIRVVTWEGKFNYSAINNFGARHTRGDFLLLLNNDVEVITPGWLEEMVMFAQRSDVGCVGAMLYYPSDKVQHAGVILGIGAVAGHAHKYFPRGDYGYMSRMTIAQNYSAVTAACLMLRRSVWDEVQGLDEAFEVAFNDVDFCLRVGKAGYRNVWTPYAELYHYESESRGAEDTPEKVRRFNGEIALFQGRWGEWLKQGDPCYNPNLSDTREDFSLREGTPAW